MIVHEDYLNLSLNKKYPLFYVNKILKKHNDSIEYLIWNWYRNVEKSDFRQKNDFGIADVLSTGLWINFNSIAREYFSLKYWCNQYEYFWISQNESKEFKEIAKNFINVKIYDPGHNCKNLLSSQTNRVVKKPRPSRLFKMGRLIQKITQKKVYKKVLAISDWTYKKMEGNKQWLFINNKSPWSSAYLTKPTSTEITKAGKQVPKKLNFIFERQSFNHVLKRRNLRLDKPLLEILKSKLVDRYRQNRPTFVFLTAMYNNLYDFYKPLEIVLPTDLQEEYAIAAKVAKNKLIKVSWLVDGYPISYNWRSLFFKYRAKENFDFIYALNHEQENACFRNGIEHKRIESPIFNYYKKQNKKKLYDVIILTWIPNDLSLTGRNGSRPQTLVDAIFAAKKSGAHRIGIKIKHNSEKKWVSWILNQNLKTKDIDLLTGPFYKHVNLAKVIIGGLGTSVAEAEFCKTPYIIYEPPENGYIKSEIGGLHEKKIPIIKNVNKLIKKIKSYIKN